LKKIPKQMKSQLKLNGQQGRQLLRRHLPVMMVQRPPTVMMVKRPPTVMMVKRHPTVMMVKRHPTVMMVKRPLKAMMVQRPLLAVMVRHQVQEAEMVKCHHPGETTTRLFHLKTTMKRHHSENRGLINEQITVKEDNCHQITLHALTIYKQLTIQFLEDLGFIYTVLL
jgi:hypothetical protein